MWIYRRCRNPSAQCCHDGTTAVELRYTGGDHNPNWLARNLDHNRAWPYTSTHPVGVLSLRRKIGSDEDAALVRVSSIPTMTN